jgi:hypothetical protein
MGRSPRFIIAAGELLLIKQYGRQKDLGREGRLRKKAFVD